MFRLRSLLLAAAAAGAVAAVVVFWRHGAEGDAGLQHWLAIQTGTCPVEGNCNAGPGPHYGFWSGFGSVFPWAPLSCAGIFIAIALWLHKHNCHRHRCWRVSRHIVDGSPWCNRHHGNARTQAGVVADATPPFASVEQKFDKLSADISGLAEAIRSSLQARPSETVGMPSPDGPWSEARKVSSDGRPA